MEQIQLTIGFRSWHHTTELTGPTMRLLASRHSEALRDLRIYNTSQLWSFTDVRFTQLVTFWIGDMNMEEPGTYAAQLVAQNRHTLSKLTLGYERTVRISRSLPLGQSHTNTFGGRGLGSRLHLQTNFLKESRSQLFSDFISVVIDWAITAALQKFTRFCWNQMSAN